MKEGRKAKEGKKEGEGRKVKKEGRKVKEGRKAKEGKKEGEGRKVKKEGRKVKEGRKAKEGEGRKVKEGRTEGKQQRRNSSIFFPVTKKNLVFSQDFHPLCVSRQQATEPCSHQPHLQIMQRQSPFPAARSCN